MFENESKEYAHTKHCKKCSTEHCEKKCILVKDDYETFKDGAEFGYNKAKEDADKMKSRFLELCNLKDMRIAELEKANEWHKVTEKLPKHENLVCNQDGEPCWYDSETDQWLDVEGTRTKTIEWCDMPTKESE